MKPSRGASSFRCSGLAAANSRNIILIIFIIQLSHNEFETRVSFAQSIGYHPNINIGFNPYMSPIHGYGLGLPFGSYGTSLVRNPFLGISMLGAHSSFAGKLHTKNVWKKLASSSYGLAPYYATLGNKLTLLKHPGYQFTPHGADYGFGKHYGSAYIANNPYKSAYGDYYSSSNTVSSHGSPATPLAPIGEPIADSIYHKKSFALDKMHGLIKPLMKTGAFLAAVALLGKKKLDVIPSKLNPAGMILSSESENIVRAEEVD